MIEHFNIRTLLVERASQPSFHIASEQHVRVEFRNMTNDEELEPFTYDGDVVLTCFRGAFELLLAGGPIYLAELDLAVVPAGTRMLLRCVDKGTVQLVWAPAHARTVKG